MPRAMPRMTPSLETRKRISLALRGKPRPEHVKAAISAKMLGRKHTDAAKAKMSAAAKRRKGFKQRRKALNKSQRYEQLIRDLVTCAKLGWWDLRADVEQSAGWRWRRKQFDPTRKVSDGWGTATEPNVKHIRLDTIAYWDAIQKWLDNG